MKKVLLGLTALSSLAYGKHFYMVEEYPEVNVLPSFSIAAPSGFAAENGEVFAGIGGISRGDETDAGLAVGMGYGNGEYGGVVTLGIGSIDYRDGGAGNRGSLGLSFGKNFQDHNIGVSVGVTQIDLWHDSREIKYDSPSVYLSASKIFDTPCPVVMTLGVGNNRYSMYTKEESTGRYHPFGSVAIYVKPQFSLIMDITSGITSVGAGITPMPKIPVTFMVGAYDIGELDEKGVGFIGTMSIGYNF